MDEKEPLEGCDHLWQQRGFWDGKDEAGNRVDEDGNYIGGPKAKCIRCDGTAYFQWSEWNSLPVGKRINL